MQLDNIDNDSPFGFKDYSQKNLCSSFVATAILGAAAIGGISQAFAANKAAKVQKEATDKAASTSLGMYNQTRGDLAPYREMGGRASTELESRLPFLTSPIVMDQEALEATPGYKFTRDQGLKAVQNSAAARGLGVSGAALKGAATFATGLADTTYKTQFDVENTNRTNAFTRLKSLVDTGAGAAAGGGALGEKAAYNAAQAQIGGGNAQAAGINATGNAIANAANNFGGYMAYRGLYGPGGNAPGAPGNYGGSPETNANLLPIGA